MVSTLMQLDQFDLDLPNLRVRIRWTGIPRGDEEEDDILVNRRSVMELLRHKRSSAE